MKVGHPFKARWTGRPPIGMLLVPDILKFKVPAPFAFVKANPEKEARETSKHPRNSHRDETKLLSSGDYKFTKECQLTVNNFNNCIRNSSLETCAYYANYVHNSNYANYAYCACCAYYAYYEY